MRQRQVPQHRFCAAQMRSQQRRRRPAAAFPLLQLLLLAVAAQHARAQSMPGVDTARLIAVSHILYMTFTILMWRPASPTPSAAANAADTGLQSHIWRWSRAGLALCMYVLADVFTADRMWVLQARAGCTVSYSCPNFSFARTPFGVSGASYNLATGQLCYRATAANPCTSCSIRACRATTGAAESC